MATLKREGYLCYSTSGCWLGFPDEMLRRLCEVAVEAGFNHA